MNQDEVIAFLSKPGSFGPGIDDVERHETHGAIVFLAGDRAYKLKRAVRYPYMDYSTPERRRAMCLAELAVNRRTAPHLYLEVRAIVRDGDRISFGAASDPAALDWVVVMRRFEQSALLEEMRKRGALNSEIVRKLADAISAFHKSVEICTTEGGSKGILRVVEENVALLRSFQDNPFDEAKIEDYGASARKALGEVSDLLESRRIRGFVRRCHGDLHLNNICLIDDEPLLFDAIEFGEEFSCIDVLYDLAFLLTDLCRHGLGRLANEVLNRYLEQASDLEGLRALPLFLSCRAAIRAHVTATLASKTRDERPILREAAASYLDLAVGMLNPKSPLLVAIGGPSGTGKSTLARSLAPLLGRSPGAIILRTDIVRKKLLGVQETVRLPQDAYSTEMTARVYALVAGYAHQILSSGFSVVVDATFGQAPERREIASVAAATGVGFRGVWLTAPRDLLEQRVASRGKDASDATVEVLRDQLSSFQPPADWQTADVAGTPDEVARRAERILGLTERR